LCWLSPLADVTWTLFKWLLWNRGDVARVIGGSDGS
ncbi:hypothetical protein LCGC14_3115950, partial [marine sediment metagenome]